MTVDMVVNVLLILFVANNLAILYMSNIGYVFSHVLALSAFLLLRRDRPDWPRPIRGGAGLGGAGRRLLPPEPAVRDLGRDPAGAGRAAGRVHLHRLPLLPGHRRPGAVGAAVLLPPGGAGQARITFRDKDVATMPSAEQMALLREEVSAR